MCAPRPCASFCSSSSSSVAVVFWGNGYGSVGKFGQPMIPSSSRASTSNARQTAYCPPRKNPFVPSIGSSVQNLTHKKKASKERKKHQKKREGKKKHTTKGKVKRKEKEGMQRTSCTPTRRASVFANDSRQKRLGVPQGRRHSVRSPPPPSMPGSNPESGEGKGGWRERGLRQDVVLRARPRSSSLLSFVAVVVVVV